MGRVLEGNWLREFSWMGRAGQWLIPYFPWYNFNFARGFERKAQDRFPK